MPKGRHKGARRQFTNFEAESERKEREEKEAAWRARRGELPSDNSDEEGSDKKEEEDSEEEESSEEESSDGEEKVKKNKGVEGLIELENPNRTGVKTNRKVTALDTDAAAAEKPQLSRREREELEKGRAAQHYRKLHSAGKTDEARADLERLAIVRARREAADQKKKEQAEAAKEAAESKAPTKKKT